MRTAAVFSTKSPTWTQTNTAWQRDLSASFQRIGDVQIARGDLNAALGAYEDSHSVFDKLAKQDTDNANWKLDLSGSTAKFGNVQLAQAHVKKQLDAYWKSLVSQELLASYGNYESQLGLVTIHAKLHAVADLEKGGVMRAKQHYEVALAMLRELKEKNRLAAADEWRIKDLKARLAALSRHTAVP
jgi:tetratricopeptide (TPR) repeat protein